MQDYMGQVKVLLAKYGPSEGQKISYGDLYCLTVGSVT